MVRIKIDMKQPGFFYLGFECDKCKERYTLGVIETFKNKLKKELKCPFCGSL